MIYELNDTSKVKQIFDGWNETLIYSCIQKVMGKIYVTDIDNPKSAFAYVGCFGFYAGEPEKELVVNKPDGFVIMIPQNEAWAKLIEACFPTSKQVTRYAIKKNTVFNEELLRKNVCMLPDEYELKNIDADIYDKCLDSPVTADFVSSFESKEQYLSIGRGMVITKNNMIVAGASSYTRYIEGIEIEVDTVPDERRKYLATIVCSALILNCLEEGLYPSWDAQNMNSVRLAESLGYEYDHEYIAYEVRKQNMNIEEQFNLIANEYDINRRKFIPCFDDYYIASTKLILSSIAKPNSVLDLGAGTGLLSYYWYRECDDANYVLVDIADDMLNISRRRFEGIQNVRHMVLDYTKQFPEDSYDAVISALSIHHLSDVQKAELFQKIYDKLPIGGWFVNYDQFCGNSPEISKKINAYWEKQLYGSGLDDRDIELWKERRKLDRECSVETEMAMLNNCQFRNVQCVYSYHKFSVIVAQK